MLDHVVRGPLLVPNPGGSVAFHADGALAADATGTLQFVGPWSELQSRLPQSLPVRPSDGVMLPPLLDVHTHVPQHPIRGRFVEGIPDDAPEGKLLAGLKRNVFPAEVRCRVEEHAQRGTKAFLADCLSHGVVGGAAYMTPSAVATEAALCILPATWSVGLVLMNQHCPADLCTDAATLDADVDRLARKFGRRLIITDRFAVAVTTPLRRRGSSLAARFGLRTQTHLDEQRAEKALVERELYPDAQSYADVYRRDGLLDHDCIAAHCIHVTDDEWSILADTATTIAHCPTSNLLLGSGTMDLGAVLIRNIPYALATDVGASPTVSMLAEIARFLSVHQGRSTRATPSEGLYRATLAPAIILGLEATTGLLAPGRPMSFIEAATTSPIPETATADDAIRALLPTNPDAPDLTVNRVTLAGRVAYERGDPPDA